MSLNLFDGIMGVGKTDLDLNLILDELTNGDRHVYTNLPIKPDVIARELARNRPTRMREVLDRLHMVSGT